ncbi:adenylate kinase family protein [Methanococcoides sp. NM1]|uniref:adenylate kinase family protein n=1 Tax=Methanococcoides sp. NM1 TaxID=1201013 RepID=UPI0010844D41|nr:adenylate kinase family protein [Methanococcoides sp. NM1]
MIIGLTGTPGTGKTSVCRILEGRGYRVIHMNDLIKNEHLYSEVDEERDTVVADMDRVLSRVCELVGDDESVTILDSHMSHYIADIVIVLRTAPSELKKRLEARNYSDPKVQENVEAECLDVILVESVEWCQLVYEVDTTGRDTDDVAEDVERIISSILSGDDTLVYSQYKPGSFDWSEEIF